MSGVGRFRRVRSRDMTLFQTVANAANKAVFPLLLRIPGLAGLLGRSMVVLEYTGRKSGRTIRLPVNYKQKGDTVTVTVAAPGQKSWWKNFSGDGAPDHRRVPRWRSARWARDHPYQRQRVAPGRHRPDTHPRRRRRASAEWWTSCSPYTGVSIPSYRAFIAARGTANSDVTGAGCRRGTRGSPAASASTCCAARPPMVRGPSWCPSRAPTPCRPCRRHPDR